MEKEISTDEKIKYFRKKFNNLRANLPIDFAFTVTKKGVLTIDIHGELVILNMDLSLTVSELVGKVLEGLRVGLPYITKIETTQIKPLPSDINKYMEQGLSFDDAITKAKTKETITKYKVLRVLILKNRVLLANPDKTEQWHELSRSMVTFNRLIKGTKEDHLEASKLFFEVSEVI